AGIYQLEITVEDLGGNIARKVIPLQVLPTPPKITLHTNPTDSVLSAGSELRLEWESRGVEPDYRGLLLEFTLDGEHWVAIFDPLPADGSVEWRLPPVDSNRCRLRLTLTRSDGLTDQTWSGMFTISSTRPRVRVQGIRPARPGEN
ncbi:MAG: hypothetical protein V3T77_05630, partial [Planctomycetota bacterium]